MKTNTAIIYIDSSLKNNFIFTNWYINGLVKINNKSIIDSNIDLLKTLGFKDIYIVVEKKYKKLIKHFFNNNNVKVFDIESKVEFPNNWNDDHVLVLKDNVILNEVFLNKMDVNLQNDFLFVKKDKKIIKDIFITKKGYINNKKLNLNSLTKKDNKCSTFIKFDENLLQKIDSFSKLLQHDNSYERIDDCLMLTPGPLNLRKCGQEPLIHNAVHHRAPIAKYLFQNLANNIKYIFGSKNGFPIAMLSTGLACIESCFANLTAPNQKALILSNGFFGENLVKNAKHYKLDYEVIKVYDGQVFDFDEIDEKLVGKSICFVTHHETSTGVVNDIESIGHLCKKHNVLLVVDAVSSLVNHEFKFDKWNVAAAVGTSTKGIETTPGLSLLCLSDEALLMSEQISMYQSRSIYLDWNSYRNKHLYNGLAPSTFPMGLISSINECIEDVKKRGGIKKQAKNKRKFVNYFYEKLLKHGFEMIPDSSSSSNWMIVVQIPSPLNSFELRAYLYVNFNILIETGIMDSTNSIIRIGIPVDFSMSNAKKVVNEIIKFKKFF